MRHCKSREESSALQSFDHQNLSPNLRSRILPVAPHSARQTAGCVCSPQSVAASRGPSVVEFVTMAPKLAVNRSTYSYVTAAVFMLNMMFGTGPVAYVCVCVCVAFVAQRWQPVPLGTG